MTGKEIADFEDEINEPNKNVKMKNTITFLENRISVSVDMIRILHEEIENKNIELEHKKKLLIDLQSELTQAKSF